MCGIIWAKRLDKRQVKKSLRKRYDNQSHRGKEGYGFIEIQEDVISEGQRFQHEKDMEKALMNTQCDSMLFHHRFPTSTPNVEEATHPIEVKNEKLKYDYYVVHNGIIRNADARKTEHEKAGFAYNTYVRQKYLTRNKVYTVTGSEQFNDSEALAIDVALMLDNGGSDIASTGSIAFIALQIDKETRKIEGLFFGRNTNPLVLEQTREIVTLSSEGKGKDVEAYKLFKFDYNTNEVGEVRKITFGGYGGYTAPSNTTATSTETGGKYLTGRTYHSELDEEDWGDGYNYGFRSNKTARTDNIDKELEDLETELNGYTGGSIVVEHHSKSHGSDREIFLTLEEFYEGYHKAYEEKACSQEDYETAKENGEADKIELAFLLDEMLEATKRLNDFTLVYDELTLEKEEQAHE